MHNICINIVQSHIILRSVLTAVQACYAHYSTIKQE